ncbi:MAG: hypothetical protein C0432_04240 [Candidatus Puniceispirillum sp.]|nr:hypothetical protein [Candidatus Pelagibacter sp.]MBA4283485.1 hypothetical protein [Candidatus Puniceispirillum sp.]
MNLSTFKQTTQHNNKNLQFKQEFEKLYFDALAQENLSLAFKILQTLQNQDPKDDSECPCKLKIQNIDDFIFALQKWIS